MNTNSKIHKAQAEGGHSSPPQPEAIVKIPVKNGQRPGILVASWQPVRGLGPYRIVFSNRATKWTEKKRA
jgi:hypothetical protein